MLDQGIFADPYKVSAISEWLKPKTITKARSFYDLGSFYTRFIRHFSFIIAPTGYWKKGSF